ncbi:MAG: hypothetical protein R3A13_12750 [Bdellovibrionota bacterium]
MTNPAVSGAAGNGPDDLRGDLAGLLGYAYGNADGTTNFDAILPPGQFLPEVVGLPATPALLATANYQTPNNPGWPVRLEHPFSSGGGLNFYQTPDPTEQPLIIIVTHRRPSGAAEYARINQLVNLIPVATPIYFVYFPTNSWDSAPGVIQNLQTALNIVPGGGGDANNQLIWFSPYHPKYQGLYSNNAGTANEWQDYSLWLRNEIYNTGSQDHIGKVARRFVYLNILDYKLLW